MTTTLDHPPALAPTQPAPPDGRPSLARRDRLGLALSELFSMRDDLAGVSLVADVLAEDVLWSV